MLEVSSRLNCLRDELSHLVIARALVLASAIRRIHSELVINVTVWNQLPLVKAGGKLSCM